MAGCLVPLTGQIEVDGPKLEKALQECDARMAGLRAWADRLR